MMTKIIGENKVFGPCILLAPIFEGNGKFGRRADPKKAWMRILKEAGIEKFRIHELQRTLGGYPGKWCRVMLTRRHV